MTAQQALYMFGSFHYFAFCMLIFQPFAASSQLLQTQKVGKIPRPPAREIGRISRWHLPDLNFTPNNERTYHLISGQYYKLQLENRDFGPDHSLVFKLQKRFTLPRQTHGSEDGIPSNGKTFKGGIRHCIFFPIDDDSLISLLYSFIPDRQRDRFLSHVWVFCPFVNFEVGK